jgi:hypothetical protein
MGPPRSTAEGASQVPGKGSLGDRRAWGIVELEGSVAAAQSFPALARRSAKDLGATRLYITQNPSQWQNDRVNPYCRNIAS